MKRIKSNVIWQGESWRLRVDQLQLENGVIISKGVVDHPGSVLIVPLLNDNEVVMIEQYRPILDRRILELPAGTRQPHENIFACAQRELREETGYYPEHLMPLGEIVVSPGVSNEIMHLFLARQLHFDPLPMDVDEMIENRQIPLDQLVEMALDGTLQDAKTVLGILRAQHYLKNRPNPPKVTPYNT